MLPSSLRDTGTDPRKRSSPFTAPVARIRNRKRCACQHRYAKKLPEPGHLSSNSYGFYAGYYARSRENSSIAAHFFAAVA